MRLKGWTVCAATPLHFFCKEGAGGACYEGSTDCYDSGCPNMGSWKKGSAYSKDLAGFKAFCQSWGANAGVFNGGAGKCPA